jgi:sensor histidine kinase YesM
MSSVIDLSEPPPRRHWLVGFTAVWTGVVVFLAVTLKLQKTALTMGEALLSKAIEGYSLALLSLLVWHVSARIHKSRWRIPAHIALGLFVLVVWKGVHLAYFYAKYGARFWALIFAESWVFQALMALAMYGALLGGVLALQASQREREREVREARLELATREAEFNALRAQLHPHFLFNSLNSILQLIDEDAPRAREMVVRLADVMQASLGRAGLDQVPLAREVDLMRAYLDIEKIRFASRLRVDIDVTDDAAAANVPPLVLQPLVENAVKHGIAPHPAGGAVGIAARVSAGRLLLEVSDTGNGSSTATNGGLGIDLTRRRLTGVYGSDYALAFDRTTDRFVVRLDLPLEPALHGA